jgi:hypothetical protein
MAAAGTGSNFSGFFVQLRNGDGASGVACRTDDSHRERQRRQNLNHQSRLPPEFFEQRPSVFYIDGIEAFGEPVVNSRDDGSHLVATLLIREQPCETGRRTQLQSLRMLLARNIDRFLKARFGLCFRL